MTEAVCLLIGLVFGLCVAGIGFSHVQLSRIDSYEKAITELRTSAKMRVNLPNN